MAPPLSPGSSWCPGATFQCLQKICNMLNPKCSGNHLPNFLPITRTVFNLIYPIYPVYQPVPAASPAAPLPPRAVLPGPLSAAQEVCISSAAPAVRVCTKARAATSRTFHLSCFPQILFGNCSCDGCVCATSRANLDVTIGDYKCECRC